MWTGEGAWPVLVSPFPSPTPCGITPGPPAYSVPAEPGAALAGSGGCDDQSPVDPDPPAGMAGHVPDLGQAAVSALAHRRGAPAAADCPPAQRRHLRGPCLGQRHAVHDVGDPTRPPPPA